MSGSHPAPLVVNGWTVFATRCSSINLKQSLGRSKGSRDKTRPDSPGRTPPRAAIARLAFEVIPQDPSGAEYRQGNTLGEDRKHWFRAKFFQQYRLFFRYHAPSKVIVHAWVNDEGTRRAYESSDDACRVFRKMLGNGHPPDDWNQLLAEARTEGDRLQRIAAGVAQAQP